MFLLVLEGVFKLTLIRQGKNPPKHGQQLQSEHLLAMRFYVTEDVQWALQWLWATDQRD